MNSLSDSATDLQVSQQSTPAAGQAPHTLAADLISTLRNMVTNVEIYEFEDVSDSALERYVVHCIGCHVFSLFFSRMLLL